VLLFYCAASNFRFDPFVDQDFRSELCLTAFSLSACYTALMLFCRVGGIKAQIDDGKTGFLVDPVNIQETAEKIVYLISNPSACQEISKAARESVRMNFLLPRMMYNHLLLFGELDKIKYEEPSSESDSDTTVVQQS
jgi:hypothetical protein